MAHYKRVLGEKVYLSPISLENVDTFMEWLNDPEVIWFTTFHSEIMSLIKEKEAVENLAKSGTNFSIVTRDDDNGVGKSGVFRNKVIGNCGFFRISEINRTADVCIIIGEKDYWGKGYGSDALRLLIKFGFENRNFNSINLRVFSFNERAIACYEKVGFKRQGTCREAVIRGNRKYDLIYMDILASEYFEKKGDIQ